MKPLLEFKFRKRFPNLHYKKLVLYRNPSDFNNMHIERINPNHHGIIWGQRKKNLKKGTGYIKAGEIWFSIITLTYGLSNLAWIDMVTGYLYSLLLQMTVLSFCTCFILSVMLYYMPLRLSNGVKA